MTARSLVRLGAQPKAGSDAATEPVAQSSPRVLPDPAPGDPGGAPGLGAPGLGRPDAHDGAAQQDGPPGKGVGSAKPRAAGGRSRSGGFSRHFNTAVRLAGLQAVVLAAVLAAALLALMQTTRAGVQSIAVGQLDAELRAFQTAADSRPAGTSLNTFSADYLRSHAVPSGDLLEVSSPGRWAVANQGGAALLADPAVHSLGDQVPPSSRVSSRKVSGRDVELLATPVVGPDQPPAVFVASVDLTALRPADSAATHLAFTVALIALVAGVASAYLLLRRLLRRVGGITRTAEAIGRSGLEERLGDQGTSDEVGQLAHSFDSMLDRIQGAVTAQHELLSDVSHQLRTPLTVARGHLEILGRTDVSDAQAVKDTIAVAIDEIDHMETLVARLLDLGRAREPVRHDVHDVDLRAFMADLHRSCQVMAPRHWLLTPIPDEVIAFDETEVRGAILNLVDNAVKATAESDVISLSASVAGPVLRFTVEDAGPGIPEAEREAVLNRFARRGRPDPTRTGLGLAIVSAVCESHGGRVAVARSKLGGAAVTMEIRRIPAGRDR